MAEGREAGVEKEGGRVSRGEGGRGVVKWSEKGVDGKEREVVSTEQWALAPRARGRRSSELV